MAGNSERFTIKPSPAEVGAVQFEPGIERELAEVLLRSNEQGYPGLEPLTIREPESALRDTFEPRACHGNQSADYLYFSRRGSREDLVWLQQELASRGIFGIISQLEKNRWELTLRGL